MHGCQDDIFGQKADNNKAISRHQPPLAATSRHWPPVSLAVESTADAFPGPVAVQATASPPTHQPPLACLHLASLVQEPPTQTIPKQAETHFLFVEKDIFLCNNRSTRRLSPSSVSGFQCLSGCETETTSPRPRLFRSVTSRKPAAAQSSAARPEGLPLLPRPNNTEQHKEGAEGAESVQTRLISA